MSTANATFEKALKLFPTVRLHFYFIFCLFPCPTVRADKQHVENIAIFPFDCMSGLHLALVLRRAPHAPGQACGTPRCTTQDQAKRSHRDCQTLFHICEPLVSPPCSRFLLIPSLLAPPPLQESEKEFDRALELDPTSSPAYVNKGMLYIRQGKMQDGLEFINKALEIDPKCEAVRRLSPVSGRSARAARDRPSRTGTAQAARAPSEPHGLIICTPPHLAGLRSQGTDFHAKGSI